VAGGALVDERRDPVTVRRPGGERPEDEEVQGSLHQRKRMGFRHASLRRCGESDGWWELSVQTHPAPREGFMMRARVLGVRISFKAALNAVGPGIVARAALTEFVLQYT